MTGHRLHYADNLATEAKKRAIATEEKVMEILNNPSEEELKSKAKQIPMDIEEANRDIPQAVDQGIWINAMSLLKLLLLDGYFLTQYLIDWRLCHNPGMWLDGGRVTTQPENVEENRCQLTAIWRKSPSRV